MSSIAVKSLINYMPRHISNVCEIIISDGPKLINAFVDLGYDAYAISIHGFMCGEVLLKYADCIVTSLIDDADLEYITKISLTEKPSAILLSLDKISSNHLFSLCDGNKCSIIFIDHSIEINTDYRSKVRNLLWLINNFDEGGKMYFENIRNAIT